MATRNLEHTFRHKLAVIIATKDRPREIQSVLSSILDQSVRPDQVIVVDGGDSTVEAVIDEFAGLDIQYMRVHPPALTKQKNAGVASVRPDIDLIGFIDDDVVFCPGSLLAMMAFWELAPAQVGGASFNISDFDNTWSWLKSLPQRLFFIDNRELGKVLRSGFNTPIWNVKKDSPVQWLGGGYTVWRKVVFDRWRFDEWFTGSGLFEDVHFSYRVGKQYQLAVVADAMAAHMEPPMSTKGQVQLGKTQILNWLYFVKHNPDLSILMCLWACVGRTATNLAKGVIKLNLGFILRALGNTLGLVTGVSGAMTPYRRDNSA